MDLFFSNFSVHISSVTVLFIFILSTLAYIKIFKEHHKRNKLNYVEISEIYISFVVLVIISLLVLIFAWDLFLTGMNAIEYREERLSNFVFAVILTTGIIWNFIRFLKHNLKDFEKTEKEEKDSKKIKVGETLELIFFTIIIFAPIWRIPEFITMIEDKKHMLIEIGISFFYSIVSIFVLMKLNPLNITEKLKLK